MNAEPALPDTRQAHAPRRARSSGTHLRANVMVEHVRPRHQASHLAAGLGGPGARVDHRRSPRKPLPRAGGRGELGGKTLGEGGEEGRVERGVLLPSIILYNIYIGRDYIIYILEEGRIERGVLLPVRDNALVNHII